MRCRNCGNEEQEHGWKGGMSFPIAHPLGLKHRIMWLECPTFVPEVEEVYEFFTSISKPQLQAQEAREAEKGRKGK